MCLPDTVGTVETHTPRFPIGYKVFPSWFQDFVAIAAVNWNECPSNKCPEVLVFIRIKKGKMPNPGITLKRFSKAKSPY